MVFQFCKINIRHHTRVRWTGNFFWTKLNILVGCIAVLNYNKRINFVSGAGIVSLFTWTKLQAILKLSVIEKSTAQGAQNPTALNLVYSRSSWTN